MNRYKRVAWVLCISWMGLIFYLSHQPGADSSELSSWLVRWFLSFVSVFPIDLDPLWVHVMIRKGAHFFAYFVLGVLVVNALRGVRALRVSTVLMAVFICVLYAVSDEIHQLYIPGRSGEGRDVLLDSVGAICGIAMYCMVMYNRSKGDGGS